MTVWMGQNQRPLVLPLARVPLAEAMERQQADDGPEDQARSDHGIRSLLHHLAKGVLACEQRNAKELHALQRSRGFWLEVLRCRDRLIVRHRRGPFSSSPGTWLC